MLTRKDIDDLFELLAIFRKNDTHLREKNLRSAWLLVLSPYNKNEVREAVGAWFRQSKYWPEPSEIAALCPPLVQGKQTCRGCLPDGAQENYARMNLDRMKRFLQQLREENSASMEPRGGEQEVLR